MTEDSPRHLWWIPSVVASEIPEFDKIPEGLDRAVHQEVHGAILADEAQGCELMEIPDPEVPEHTVSRARALVASEAWGNLRETCRGTPEVVEVVATVIAKVLLAPPTAGPVAGAVRGKEGGGDDEEKGKGGGGGEEEKPEEAQARKVVAVAVGAADKEAREARAALEMLLPGTAHLPPGDPGARKGSRLDIARRLLSNPLMRRIIEEAGRIAARAWRPRRVASPQAVGPIDGITLGDDLTRIVPSELALLNHPIARRLVYKALLEKSAQQYRMRGDVPQAERGPMLILIDESGSMGWENKPFRRIEIATAFAIGCVQIAAQRNRGVLLAGFDTYIRWSRDIPARSPSMTYFEAIEHLARMQADGGGTDLSHPMEWALNRVTAKFRADVLVVTDGETHLDASVRSRINQRRKQDGMQVHTIVIGGSSSGLAAAGAYSDTVVPLRDLDQLIEVGDHL